MSGTGTSKRRMPTVPFLKVALLVSIAGLGGLGYWFAGPFGSVFIPAVVTPVVVLIVSVAIERYREKGWQPRRVSDGQEAEQQ